MKRVVKEFRIFSSGTLLLEKESKLDHSPGRLFYSDESDEILVAFSTRGKQGGVMKLNGKGSDQAVGGLEGVISAVELGEGKLVVAAGDMKLCVIEK